MLLVFGAKAAKFGAFAARYGVRWLPYYGVKYSGVILIKSGAVKPVRIYSRVARLANQYCQSGDLVERRQVRKVLRELLRTPGYIMKPFEARSLKRFLTTVQDVGKADRLTDLGLVERSKLRLVSFAASQALKRAEFTAANQTVVQKPKGINWLKEVKLFFGSILAMAAFAAYMDPTAVWDEVVEIEHELEEVVDKIEHQLEHIVHKEHKDKDKGDTTPAPATPGATTPAPATVNMNLT